MSERKASIKMNNDSLNAVLNGIKNYSSFSILTHVSPDGDTLGAALALHILLTRLGKRSEVLCDERVPHIYGFLPCAENVLTADTAEGLDCVIAVDCADAQRFKKADGIFKNAKLTMVIDHHFTNKGYADINLIRPEASATCEIIYDIFKGLDLSIDSGSAICLYTGIVTDTGNLTYSNTTPNSIRIVAELYEEGLNITEVNRSIYRTVPYAKTRVQGYALANMQLYDNGRIGLATLTVAQMDSFGATDEDCEGIVDQVRDVECVRVAAFVREGRDGTFKVSLRSKECADVGKIAKSNGGGGHEAAAGYTSKEPLSTTVANVLAAIEAELL